MAGPRAFVHQALIYSSGEEFVSASVHFIQAGLASNEPVFVVTDPDKAALLSDALGDASGRVSFGDRASWYHAPAARRLSDLYRLFREQQEDGPGRIRVIGEPVWAGRSDTQIREWKRFESLVNVACAPFPVLALCPYDARALPPSILADACRTHPELVSGSKSDPNPAFVDPRAFIRELDEGQELREPETAAAHPFFHGDLAGLRRFVVEQASRAGVGRKRSAELEWAANEVATNVLRHGRGEGTARVWSVSGELVCEIVDRGPGIDDPLAGHLPPDPDRELGPGLWLVHQLCDLVEVRSSASGSTVRLHILLDEAA